MKQEKADRNISISKPIIIAFCLIKLGRKIDIKDQ